MPRPPKQPAAPRKRRQVSTAQASLIDYRDPSSLLPYITERGRIKSRANTGLSRRDQNRLATAIKRARELALLPYPGTGVEAKPGSRRGRRDSA